VFPAPASDRRAAAFLRRGLAPRARRSLQELPCFPLRGSAAATRHEPPPRRVARPQLSPHAPRHRELHGWEGRGEGPSLLQPAPDPPTHPRMLQGQIRRLQSTRHPRSEPPQRAGSSSLLPGRLMQHGSPVPPPGCRRCLTSTFRLRPRRGVGTRHRQSQLSSRGSLRDRGDVSTGDSRHHPRALPPSLPHTMVRRPGLPLLLLPPSSSSSSPSLQHGASSSHPLALISHV